MSKICLITGAAKGIGKATLLRFLQQGYSCIGIDQDEQAVDHLLAELSDPQRKQIYFEIADLTHDIDSHKWSAPFRSLLHPTPYS